MIMNKLFLLTILIVFVSGCATEVNENKTQEQQPPTEEQPVQESPQPPGGVLEGEVVPQEQPQSPPSLTTVKEFSIEADDYGFYLNSQKISSVSVNKEEVVKITFQVKKEQVYYNGLDFRGCGQDTPDTKPGAFVDIQFTVDSTCTITAYWPASDVAKASLQIIVS